MINSRVILLCIVRLLTIMCYKVKVFGGCIFLEKYGTKCFGAGTSVYFHLSFGAIVIVFLHGCRYHVMLKFFICLLPLVSPCKKLILAC